MFSWCDISGGFGSLSDSWLKDKSPENCLTSVEIYDPESDSWSQGRDLPVPLCSMGVVKYYGTVYVLGMCTKFLFQAVIILTVSEDYAVVFIYLSVRLFICRITLKVMDGVV